MRHGALLSMEELTNPPVPMKIPQASSRPHKSVQIEQELHALFTHAGKRGAGAPRWDLPHVFIDEKHHRAHRCEKTYLCAVGPVTRCALYRAPGRAGGRCDGAQGSSLDTACGASGRDADRHLVPREAEEVLGVLGNMTPSKSSLDRLPKALSARWEQFEARVREDTLEVEDTACTVAVSLDRVTMKTRRVPGGEPPRARESGSGAYGADLTLKTMVGDDVDRCEQRRTTAFLSLSSSRRMPSMKMTPRQYLTPGQRCHASSSAGDEVRRQCREEAIAQRMK